MHDRILKIIRHYNLSVTEFSREIGLNSAATIQKIITYQRKASPKTTGKILNRFPDINYDWLITGQGEMIKSSVVKSVKTHEDDLTVTTKQVIDFMKEYYPNSTQESEDRLDKKIDIGKKELIDFMYLGKSDLIDFMNAGKADLKEIIDDSFLKVLKKSEEIQHKSEDSRVKFDLAHAKTLKKVETLEKEIKVLNGKLSHIDYLVENIEKYNLIEEHRKEEIFNQNKK
jgi:hypothetical protein